MPAVAVPLAMTCIDAGRVEHRDRFAAGRRARRRCRRRSRGRRRPSAAAMRHAMTSAFTFRIAGSPVRAGASRCPDWRRPARSRAPAAVRCSDGSASAGSPTSPRSTTVPAVDRCAAVRVARPSPASTPVRPTAGTPHATSAATSSVFAVPASTETTTSSVARSVMRRPSTFFGAMARRSSSASIARPPPCTTTSGRCGRDGRRPARRCARGPRPFRAVRRRASGPAARSQQSRPFVEAARDVEVLQRLARRAFHQIVEARHDDEPARRRHRTASRCRRNSSTRRA